MIIAVDIGNTNIKLGLFEGDRLRYSWRISTDVTRTSDEHGSIIKQLIRSEQIELSQINGGIISSVIPQLNYTITHMLQYYFGFTPLIVGPGVKTGLNIKYENPRELGTDRIVNCVAASKKYGAPFILIDFGTATTFNVVNRKNEFLGGCITVGIKTGIKGLASSTACLPEVELYRPASILANNTIRAIQSGVIYGMTGQVEYIVEKLKKELGDPDCKVVATGGLSQLLDFDGKKFFDVVDRGLSLEGLNIVYNLNQKQ